MSPAPYAVLLIASDGTYSIAGPFASEARAVSFAAFAEAHGIDDARPMPLESSRAARRELLDAYMRDVAGQS